MLRYFFFLPVFLLVLTPAVTALTFKFGSYTGDGTASQAITGMGFQPEVVFVQPDGVEAFVATSSMTAGEAKLVGGSTSAPVTNRINSLDADGFTAGSSANTNLKVYYWMAFDDTDGDITVGSVVGVAATDVTVNVGYTPKWVWALGARGNYADLATMLFKTGEARSQYMGSNSDPSADGFNTIIKPNMVAGTGWTLKAGGGDGTGTGSTYHYVTFKDNTDIRQNSYAGDNTASRSVDFDGGSAFATDAIFVKRRNNNMMVFRTSDMAANVAYWLPGNQTADITNFTATGMTTGAAAGNEFINGSGTYDYMVFKGGGVLPVRLVDFKGKTVNEDVILSWRTLSEINNQGFEIMGSSDGLIWNSLGFVQGAGDSQLAIDYEWRMHQGDFYYFKLVQKDYDGAQSVSKVIYVGPFVDAGTDAIGVFPNPFSEVVVVNCKNIPSNTYQVNLYDINGLKVKSFQMFIGDGSDFFEWELGELSAGSYMLVLTSESGAIYSKRLIKK